MSQASWLLSLTGEPSHLSLTACSSPSPQYLSQFNTAITMKIPPIVSQAQNFTSAKARDARLQEMNGRVNLQGIEEAAVEDALDESKVDRDLVDLEGAGEHEQTEEDVVADQDPVLEVPLAFADDRENDVEHGQRSKANRKAQIECFAYRVEPVSHFLV